MTVTSFGQTADGQTVHAIDLTAGGLSVRLLTLGAALRQVRLDGAPWDLTLGLASVAEYEAQADGYFGVLVGPVANRLRDAAAPIAGRLHRFAPNEGPNLLHSGRRGIQARVWTLTDATAASATLVLDLPDGEGGFPGNRRLVARWTVSAPATLRLDLTGTTDAPTLMNLANHSYWNLDGGADWAGHRLCIAADAWLVVCTRSGHDIVIVRGEEEVVVPVRRITPVDATGAGDQFAAGFIYGLATGASLEVAGRMGCVAAAEVIGHYGARPEVDVKALFRQEGLI